MAKDDETALQWLEENPDNEAAPKVRAKLRSKGYDIPDPPPSGVAGEVGDIGRTLTQGVILDPLQKAGQMLEHMPGWLGREATWEGNQIMQTPGLGDYLRKNQEAAARHPYVRFAANVAPWLLVPGVGEGVLGNAAIGAIAGATQPLDPKDPNYWRDFAYQTGLGGVTGGTLGSLAGKVAANAAQRSAQEAAINTTNRWITETPERATMGVYQRIANEVGDASILPKAITPETAAAVQNAVGKKLSGVYQKMTFKPDSAWITASNNLRASISSQLVDPTARAAWDQALSNEAIRPALLADPAHPLGPITGDKLNQLVSNLGQEANDLGLKAQQGGGRAYQVMADGLRKIQQSITSQIDAANPALGAQRRAFSRGYYLSDVMVKATTAKKGGIASPTDIIGAWQTKMGKKLFGADRRFQSSKDLLQEERVRGQQPQEKLPPELTPAPTAAQRAGHALVRVGAHAAGIKAAEKMGLPWYTGSGLVEALRAAGTSGPGKSVVGPTARAAGSVPGVPAAVAGKTGPKVPDVTFDILSILPGGMNGR